MLSRYLGNKSSLLTPILSAIGSVTPSGGRVGDLFAGTLSVSLALKAAGYNVIANDINHFSSTCGRAFLQNNALPEVDPTLIPASCRTQMMSAGADKLADLRNRPGYGFLENKHHAAKHQQLAALLSYLEASALTDLPAEARRTHFFDTYTEAGANSAFRSLRGTEGRRRFFSTENGLRIDIIANFLRMWHQRAQISPELLAICSSVLCRSAEQVGNNQGTWADFPRDWIDTRAKQPLRLTPPPMDATLAGGRHLVGEAEDSLAFIERCPPMDTLYLDPPYNFRQYTSYYFLPNLITMFPFIEDLDQWFDQVEFVRGQNMSNDFSSTFCKRNEFIDDLGLLIKRASTQWIVLSYFNGRNHWNDFKQHSNGIGLQMLTDFFSSPCFVPGSLVITPIPRKNYQSYIGFKARDIDEYLFIARKEL